MYHFFIREEMISEGKVVISGSDVNHIKNVLRMKSGEELILSDGMGTDYHCMIEEVTENTVLCRILEESGALSEPSVRFYLFQGLAKGDKLEHVIQKSVELGVYEIIPVEMARSVVHYDGKKQKAKQERWQKIAESAAKQSRRGIIPEVKEIRSFRDAFAYAKGEALDLILVPYENYKDMKETKLILQKIRPDMRVGIFVGPEGGFAPEEITLAEQEGGIQISLGNRILRTETAPLMLLSVLTFALEE